MTDTEIELIYKPSIIITNTAEFEAGQLDLFNFFLRSAYKQLNKNYLRDTFTFTVKEIKEFNNKLNTRKKIREYLNTIYDKEFRINILGKDKSIESNIKTRVITMITENSDGTLEIGLEPLTINALRNMVAKIKGIETEEKVKILSYVKLPYTKQLKFYPSKVVFEICKDYEGFSIPKIDINDFKEMTQTINKYQKDFNGKVIKKIIKDLKDHIDGFDINLIKQGRSYKWVEIKSNINIRQIPFKEFYKNWLKEHKFEDNPTNKKIAEKVFKNKGEH